jgi:hypothetical protein
MKSKESASNSYVTMAREPSMSSCFVFFSLFVFSFLYIQLLLFYKYINLSCFIKKFNEHKSGLSRTWYTSTLFFCSCHQPLRPSENQKTRSQSPISTLRTANPSPQSRISSSRWHDLIAQYEPGEHEQLGLNGAPQRSGAT